MMQLNAIDRLRQMQDNESFLKELEEAQSSADVIAVCVRYGLVLTDGEVEQLTREANAFCEDQELNEDALDAVVGGLSRKQVRLGLLFIRLLGGPLYPSWYGRRYQ